MTGKGIETARGLPLPAGLKTAEIDGARLAYLEHGSGEPAVLVQGSLSDLTIRELQLAPAGERYRAIAYSRRYARPSENLPSEAKDMMQPHVEDLPAFLRAARTCWPTPRLTSGTTRPNSRRLDIPSASHVMHVENPAALNAGLLRFLTDPAEHDR